jgi:diacylglycerol kinase (ATP)
MLHLVLNPIAGRGRGLRAFQRIVEALGAAGVDLEVHRTDGPGHATEIARALPDGSTVVAVGGDGTVHEVVVGCLHRSPTLGVLPTGSGDDFAFALGIDRHDLRAGLQALRAGNVRRVDVGCVNAVPFVNGFGSGFDADVARRVLRAPGAYRGLARYLYGVAGAMRDFELRDAAVRVDGREVYAGPALLVGVQNGPRAGGSFMFSPEARPDDGLLDVLIAGSFGRLGTLGVLPRVIHGSHLGHPHIHLVRGHDVEVRWSAPVAAHVDGESLGDGEHTFGISLRRSALGVFAPGGAPIAPVAPPS